MKLGESAPMTRRIGTEMDSRKSARFRLSLPVLFSWQVSGEEEHLGCGFSTDVSSNGIYIESTYDCPPVNTAIKLEVLVPSMDSGAEALKLTALGEVVRKQTLAKAVGFGVRADFELDAFPLTK